MASALETLCGQAFGAKKYYMLGVYLQRSWIIMFICCILLLPLYLFASPILKLLGQPTEMAELTGLVSMWMIPIHFSLGFQFPLQRFLQSQLKTGVIAWMSLMALVVHVIVSWLFVYKFQFGLVGIAATLNISWWVLVFGLLCYSICGGCPLTWTGFSTEAFSGLWEFLKLSAASGVMLWYLSLSLSLSLSLKPLSCH
jgi:MATE family multidrug resistance protein